MSDTGKIYTRLLSDRFFTKLRSDKLYTSLKSDRFFTKLRNVYGIGIGYATIGITFKIR